MKNLALFLQVAVLLYFLLFLIFFLSFDAIGMAFGMDPITPESMVKVFLTGLILFLAAWGAGKMVQNKMNDQVKKIQEEMNGLKAKLYDYEHPKVVTTTKTVTPKTPEDTSGILRPRQNFTD
jgi:Skp family chaperone for outer membrane proteins